jgi:hypothetical protein
MLKEDKSKLYQVTVSWPLIGESSPSYRKIQYFSREPCTSACTLRHNSRCEENISIALFLAPPCHRLRPSLKLSSALHIVCLSRATLFS